MILERKERGKRERERHNDEEGGGEKDGRQNGIERKDVDGGE